MKKKIRLEKIKMTLEISTFLNTHTHTKLITSYFKMILKIHTTIASNNFSSDARFKSDS